MNSQIEILKIQKQKFIKQDDSPKKKLKTFIESKMIESANEVKNVHFLTLVLNYVSDPYSSIVEGIEIKLCSNCAIKKKEALFNSIRQLQYSIYKKLEEVKYTKFFSKD
ncbi:30936_t:CDS:2, partial [Gigaspora margarita]